MLLTPWLASRVNPGRSTPAVSARSCPTKGRTPRLPPGPCRAPSPEPVESKIVSLMNLNRLTQPDVREVSGSKLETQPGGIPRTLLVMAHSEPATVTLRKATVTYGRLRKAKEGIKDSLPAIANRASLRKNQHSSRKPHPKVQSLPDAGSPDAHVKTRRRNGIIAQLPKME